MMPSKLVLGITFVLKILRKRFASKQQRTLSTVLQGPYNYISGEKCSPVSSNANIKVLEPALGLELCSVQISGQDEVSQAVDVAKSAFPSWSQLPSKERGRLLIALGQKIRQKLEYIATLEVRNNGKPIWEARGDVQACAEAFEYYGGSISSTTGQHIPLHKKAFAVVCREPLGVVAGIGVWNFPLLTCSWKVAPALACGNTMVFKPSPLTPITALVLAELAVEVGIPRGVFNVIQGDEFTGSLMCRNPDVAKIAFTGSVSAGSAVMATAALNIKKVTLELGGKSPLIIFDDADIINAVKGTMLANFLTQGEVCSNGTRVFLHENIASQFLDHLVKSTKKLKIGNPLEDDTAVGATISSEHAEKVLAFIQRAKQEGAKVACGGERIFLPPPLHNGYYLSPCILVNCHDDMEVVRKEVFGAVVSVLTFRMEEEVIRRANCTSFGLAGGIFTRNIQRAFRVANSLEAGIVWINNYNLSPSEVPFGGYKQSGLGRENGTAALDHYSQLKTVYVELDDVDCGPLYPGP